MLLELLANRPSGGYELMGELQRRLAPDYKPSPGSVYPALAALHAEGLIEPDDRRGSGTFRVTPAGHRVRSAKSGVIADIRLRTSVSFDAGSPLDPVINRFVARVKELSDRVDTRTVERILERAAQAIAAEQEQHGRA